MAGKRLAAFPGLMTELLVLLSGGSGIAGRFTGLGAVFVMEPEAAAAVGTLTCRVSETVRGLARCVVAGCTTAFRVTSRTPAFAVSCTLSLVGVAPGAATVHDAVLFPVGQPLVNRGAWPESRIWTFSEGQFSAQTCTVNCAAWPR